MRVSYQLSGDSCQNGDDIVDRLEAGQEADPTAPFHYYIGLDFQPVEEGLPDDDTAVFMLLSQSDDDPVFIGFRDGGHWFYSDGSAVGATRANRVTHWAHKPEFSGVRRSGLNPALRHDGVAEFLAKLEEAGLNLADLRPVHAADEEAGRPA
ncbi:MAG: hypothetical protein PHU46_12010 [Rhodocyclaceae bacterium]|nr:hypothetical protein [Rhodocyclaceae bacterium]